VNYYLLYYIERRRRIEEKIATSKRANMSSSETTAAYWRSIEKEKIFRKKKRSLSSIRESFSLLSIYVVCRIE